MTVVDVEKNKQLVRDTWAKVLPIEQVAADLFYKRLFEIDSSAADLFQGVDIAVQGKQLMAMIGKAVNLLDDLETLTFILKSLGKRHDKYGVKDHHYDTVGAALLWTLEQGLGKDWTPEVKDAWVWVYGVMASTMKPKTKASLVQNSWAKVEPIADTAADLFYKRLFEIDSSAADLFSGVDMSVQGKALMQMIGKGVNMLDRQDELIPILKSLGKRHIRYGVKKEHYDSVGAALLWTLEQGLGSQWNDELKEAWTWVYNLMAQVMQSDEKKTTEESAVFDVDRFKDLIRQSWKTVMIFPDQAANLFYDKLLTVDATIIPLFQGLDV